TILNQVVRYYNGLGQLGSEYQEHDAFSPVSGTVQYGYNFVATSGGPNQSLLVSITYPSGRMLRYNYNSGVDSTVGRVSSISDSSGTLESYSYLGLGTIVQRSQPQPGVVLSYNVPGGNPDGGDQYTGLDRFGRVVEQRW